MEEYDNYKLLNLTADFDVEEGKRIDGYFENLFKTKSFVQKGISVVEKILNKDIDDKIVVCILPLLIEVVKGTKVKILKKDLKNTIYVLLQYLVIAHIHNEKQRETIETALILGYDNLWFLITFSIEKTSSWFPCCKKTQTQTEEYLGE